MAIVHVREFIFSLRRPDRPTLASTSIILQSSGPACLARKDLLHDGRPARAGNRCETAARSSASCSKTAAMHDFAAALRAAVRLIVSLDPDLVGIVALSLRVSLSASLVALAVGAPIGAALATSRFRGRQAIIVLANALL